MKFPAALAFALLLLTLPAGGARAGGLLGAIYDTCLANLGEPSLHAKIAVPPASDVYAFRREDWTITVFFWKHQAHLLIYQKTNGLSATSPEVEAILKGYGDGLTWTRDAAGHCLRSDGRVQARVSADLVAVYSSEFDSAAGRPANR